MKKKTSQTNLEGDFKTLKEKYNKNKQNKTSNAKIPEHKTKSVDNKNSGSSNNKDDKFFKFKDMSKLIVNKIDDILLGSGNSLSILNSDFLLDSTKDILSQLDSKPKLSDNVISNPLPIVTETRASEEKRSDKGFTKSNTLINKEISSKNALNNKTNDKGSNIVNKNPILTKYNTAEGIKASMTTLDKETGNISKGLKGKNTFMTDLDLIANEEKQAHDDYHKFSDKKINDILSTLNELDDEFKDADDPDLESDFKKDVTDIKKLFDELDSVKQGKKEEFDELQYLIKLVNNTQTSVERHMKGVNNLYSNKISEANVNKDDFSDESEEEENTQNKNSDILEFRQKNISKIKNNIFNIQDNVFSFYDHLKRNFKVK
jgi:hypothetical protein